LPESKPYIHRFVTIYIHTFHQNQQDKLQQGEHDMI